jgi:hypothetical protein
MMWFLALPRPLRAALLILAGAFLLFAGVGIWLRLHDRAVVKEHEADVTGKVLETELEAERTANNRAEVRRAEREDQSRALDDAIDEAADEHPDATRQPAGPAVRGVIEAYRRQ